MTRFAVLADIHGNLPALEAVLEDAERLGIDRYLAAGDLCNAGPCPRQVLDSLRSLNAQIVRGNGDNYLIDYHTGRAPSWWRSSAPMAPVRWAHEQLGAENLTYLQVLPEKVIIEDSIRMQHGSNRFISEGLVPDQNPDAKERLRKAGIFNYRYDQRSLREIMAEIDQTVLITAHTHVPWSQAWENKLVFNPGSVGTSFNGEPLACYAILSKNGTDAWQVELKAIAYDLQRMEKLFYDCGILEKGGAFSQACLRGCLSGKNYPQVFVNHLKKLSREAGWDGKGPWPDEAWQRTIDCFDWEQEIAF